MNETNMLVLRGNKMNMGVRYPYSLPFSCLKRLTSMKEKNSEKLQYFPYKNVFTLFKCHNGYECMPPWSWNQSNLAGGRQVRLSLFHLSIYSNMCDDWWCVFLCNE